jgi:putative ABC transport system ATP-binding protein
MFADEPTDNLDSAGTLEVLRVFRTLREDGLTLVVVTHNERIAASADRQVSMRDGAFVGTTIGADGRENRPGPDRVEG